MNNYELLRAEKIKTRSELKGRLRHAYREQDTPNADPDLLDQNTSWGATNVKEGMARFEAKFETQNKIRKNAVLGIEYLVTGSPKAINDMGRDKQDQYFDDAIKWLKEKHGEENIACYSIHRDENTCPHLHVFVVPIDERGKLNCRAFLGGTKHRMTDLQDEFHEKVGGRNNLDRGIKGSKAKHTEVRDWYKLVNSKEKNIQIDLNRQVTKKGIIVNDLENYQELAERVQKDTEKALTREVEAGKVTRLHAKRRREAERTSKKLNEKLENLERAKGSLTDEEVTQALTKARLEKDLRLSQEKIQEQAKKAQRREYFKNKGKSRDEGRG